MKFIRAILITITIIGLKETGKYHKIEPLV